MCNPVYERHNRLPAVHMPNTSPGMSSSDLKRKREESDDDALPSSYDPTSTRPAVAAIGAPTSQQHDVPTPAGKTSAGPAPVAEPEASPGITGVVAAGAKASGASKETTRTVLICGKEVPLCGGGKRKGKGKGKKRRGGPVEGMVLTAYKKELALACKANDMMSALDMYREMEVKGIKHDLEILQMVLAVCGGSPGDKDPLDPGNGSTVPPKGSTSVSSAEGASDAGSSHDVGSVPREAVAAATASESRSAQRNRAAAAEAAIQILEEVAADDTEATTNPDKSSKMRYLPESIYTAVIRACCLDGRPDKGREVLERLKRTRERPRLRSYIPLLDAYARLDGRLEDCMSLWRDAISPEQELTMSEREYLTLIKACTRARDKERFVEVMGEYMEDVLQPRSRGSWDVLKAWFRAVSSADSGNTEQKKQVTPTRAVAGATAEVEAATNGSVLRKGGSEKQEISKNVLEHVPPDGADGGEVSAGAGVTPMDEDHPVVKAAGCTREKGGNAQAQEGQADEGEPAGGKDYTLEREGTIATASTSKPAGEDKPVVVTAGCTREKGGNAQAQGGQADEGEPAGGKDYTLEREGTIATASTSKPAGEDKPVVATAGCIREQGATAQAQEEQAGEGEPPGGKDCALERESTIDTASTDRVAGEDQPVAVAARCTREQGGTAQSQKGHADEGEFAGGEDQAPDWECTIDTASTNKAWFRAVSGTDSVSMQQKEVTPTRAAAGATAEVEAATNGSILLKEGSEKQEISKNVLEHVSPVGGADGGEVLAAEVAGVTPMDEDQPVLTAARGTREQEGKAQAQEERADEGEPARGKDYAPEREGTIDTAGTNKAAAAAPATAPATAPTSTTMENGSASVAQVADAAAVQGGSDGAGLGKERISRSGAGLDLGCVKSWKISECSVAADGTCQSCGEVLRSIELAEDEEQRLLKQVEVLVCTNEKRTKQWEGYRGWLERHARERYDVIIDGANVGYYRKNASDVGELADLRQVDWAVKKFEAEGRKPLAVLHSRHLVSERLSAESTEILERWKKNKTVQSCSPNNNDDWYWLYAAVYIGGRVLLLTNDEMRDHHFGMLSHRSFERWKERHQTRFALGEWNGDMREVLTDEPRAYSKRTQMSKGSGSWHFPLEGSDDWLCAAPHR